jgi:putative ABC transport system ATP-binding protein
MISVKNLQKYVDNNTNKSHILKNINFEISSGDLVVLKGVSGSGKSTLLSIIAGLDKPTSGVVLVENEAIHKLPDMHLSNFRAKKIGIIFQSFNLIESFSVKENLLAALSNQDFALSDIWQKIDSALKVANINHKANTKVELLSGGEKQRCAIARALVNNPNILICDEPTANLDRANSLEFIKSMQNLNGSGKTIVIATHDPLFDSLPNAKVIKLEDGAVVNE